MRIGRIISSGDSGEACVAFTVVVILTILILLIYMFTKKHSWH